MKALLIVDMQHDFMQGGALEVPQANEIIPLINRLMEKFSLVAASQDWHPPNHISFAVNHPGEKEGDTIEIKGVKQILWPPHCVQNSWGAEIVQGLDQTRIHYRIKKGANPQVDSYSAFFDQTNHKSTGLDQWLKEKHVTDLYLTGVATEFCVYYTACDAIELGYRVHLIEDACRGFDPQRAVDEIRKKGGEILLSHSLL